MHWRELLLLFGLLWGLQVIGTALQMRHYRRVLASLSTDWTDGFIGSGNARSRFGRGAVVILAVSPTGRIRRALVMEGRTVWAKFREHVLPDGVDLDAVRSDATLAGSRRALADAFGAAVAQVDAVRAGRNGPVRAAA